MRDEWDYVSGHYLMKSGCIEVKDMNAIREKIILYMWEQIKKQNPLIDKLCSNKTGEFNKKSEHNFNTPIIGMWDTFYMQYVIKNDKNNWIWGSIDLEPKGFINDKDYFKNQLISKMKANNISERKIKLVVNRIWTKTRT